MNCKKGDLAVYVGKSKSQVGKIVTCVSFGGSKTLLADHWYVEPHIVRDRDGKLCGYVKDASLRPIRPTDGEDETLQWAGKPKEVTA